MDKICALVLCKDYLSKLEDTLQNLLDNGIKDAVLCNCYTGKESRDVKMIVRNFTSIHQEAQFILFDHKFKNYSQARNALFDFADEITTKDTVYLITDPGDMLKILDKQELERWVKWGRILSYFIKQDWTSETKLGNKIEKHSWYLPKLVASHNKDIRYAGYAHEYISVYYNCHKIECLVQQQDRIKWGDFKEEFNKRCDINRNLLEQELLDLEEKELLDLEEKDKKYARTLFYLGQEYVCINNFEKAFEILNKRVQFDGFLEEKFEAYHRLLCLSKTLKKDRLVIDQYFKEACLLQKRSEVYVTYIQYLISQKSSSEDLDYIHKLCDECLSLKPPSNILLFINIDSYTKERTELYLSIFPPKFEKPKECEVCYSNPQVGLLKCKHWCCQDCLNKLNNNICPFCRQPI